MMIKKYEYAYCAKGKEEFRNDFLKYFPNIRMQSLIDVILSVLFGKIVINTLLFSSQLEKLYPEEWVCKSISEIVTEHYGDEALVFLDGITC